MIKLQIDRKEQTITLLKLDISSDIRIKDLLKEQFKCSIIFLKHIQTLMIHLEQHSPVYFDLEEEVTIEGKKFLKIINALESISDSENIIFIDKKTGNTIKTCKGCEHYEPFNDLTSSSVMYCNLCNCCMNTLEICGPSFTQKKEKGKPIKYSVEQLYHFNCGSCKQWFSIGDFCLKEDITLNCPHCGNVSQQLERLEEKND